MRSLALASAFLAAATASAGCAAIAAKAPDPNRPRDQPPMCNDGKGAVAIDGLMATALGVSTIAIASEGEGGAAAIVGLTALAYGISAGVGHSSANKCRQASEEYLAMRKREEAEAAFVRDGGGSPGAMGGLAIAPEDEDAPAAAVPPPRPRPQPPEQQPAEQPPPSVAQPAPAPAAPPRPASKPPITRARAARDAGDEGDWSEFWQEVP